MAVQAARWPPAEKPIAKLDWWVRWGITAIGVGLLLGLFTRVWCVAGIGFLVMTYLNSPPWPWLPPPPPSEGNPLLINKNLIEAVALLVVLVHPTGRWLGIDAVIDYVVSRYGEFVLLKPRLSLRTILLWGAPIGLTLAGVLAVFIFSRRRVTLEQPKKLSADEEAKIRDLLEK